MANSQAIRPGLVAGEVADSQGQSEGGDADNQTHEQQADDTGKPVDRPAESVETGKNDGEQKRQDEPETEESADNRQGDALNTLAEDTKDPADAPLDKVRSGEDDRDQERSDQPKEDQDDNMAES
ncbi:hypothetical protein LTR37_013761 [Vermiconidia calcicola]|uniref:Uncharacterized protein n=1 Tax=Vermiconidia calcicola TaxID=1690605 RepID=A0ACC3MVX7_9PEZI|nr:hypothetical protein LTR37_013761 [Vermiconidia calcicola]